MEDDKAGAGEGTPPAVATDSPKFETATDQGKAAALRAASAATRERLRNAPPPIFMPGAPSSSVPDKAAPEAKPAAAAGSPPADGGEREESPSKPSEAEAVPTGTKDAKPSPRLVSTAAVESEAIENWEEYVAKRFNGDEAAAKKAVFETDKRAAESAKALKAKEAEVEALKAKAPPEPPDEPEAPATPLDPQAIEATAEEHTKEFAEGDDQCRALVDKYNETLSEQQEIVKTDAKGRVVGGALVDAKKDVAYYGRLLDPKQNGGLNLEDLTEEGVTKERDFKDRLRTAKDEVERLTSKHERLTLRARTLATDYDTRLKSARAHFKDRLSRAAAETQESDRVTREATEFDGAWDASFKDLLSTKGLKADDPAAVELEKELLEKASVVVIVNGGDILPKDLPLWMKEHAKKLSDKEDKLRGAADVQRAKDKERVTAQTGPTGPAATARPIPKPSETQDQRERFRAARSRTALLSRQVRQVG